MTGRWDDVEGGMTTEGGHRTITLSRPHPTTRRRHYVAYRVSVDEWERMRPGVALGVLEYMTERLDQDTSTSLPNDMTRHSPMT